MVRDKSKAYKIALYRFVIFALIFSNVYFVPSLARAWSMEPNWSLFFAWMKGYGKSLDYPNRVCFEDRPNSLDTVCLNGTDYNALPQNVKDLFAGNIGFTPSVDTSGNVVFPNGTTLGVDYTITLPPPPPPASLNAVLDGIVSGELYDQNGQVYAQIAPVDLAGVPDANVTCTASNSRTTACVYVAPSGTSYTTYLPTGSETGSAYLEQTLSEAYRLARARPGTINTWDSRDIALQNAVLGYASNENMNFAISQSGGYVLAVAQTTNGSSEVIIDLYNTPNKMNATGQYNPSTDMEEKLITLSFGRGSATTEQTVNNVNTGSAPIVDNAVGAVQALSSMPQVSAVSSALQYYVSGNSITAVNPVTGQTLGTVHLEGQTLSPSSVTNVVNYINNNPSTVSGGKAVSGSAPGSNSGNVGSNTSTTAGSLPTEPAAKAGSGSGTNQLGKDGFYQSRYPAGTTLQSLYASHLASIQGMPFVSTLNSLKPTFGSGGLPQMCFSLTMFPGNYCVDFGHYAFVFDAIKAIVLLSAVFSAYSIIIVKKA